MNKSEIKEKLIGIIVKYLSKKLTKEQVFEDLVHSIVCEEIYVVDELLISDSYFALKHILEENISDEELKYLLICLKGQCEYSLDDKLRLLQGNGLKRL